MKYEHHMYVPCYVRDQLTEITGGQEMKIVTQDGFLYEFDLEKEEEITAITGGDWADLINHYCLYYHDKISVNLVGNQEFLTATILDDNNKEKTLIDEPGHDDIINSLVKPPSLTLSPTQIDRVIFFPESTMNVSDLPQADRRKFWPQYT